MTESLVLNTGLEPIAGYTLVRLLGRGGFGEVWEARAPGDFHVAMKFLRLDTVEAGVEQRALEVIRNIRHGHLLDVQFATRVADCLVIGMPLCDQSLMDRLSACLAERKPSVPRNELLRYMDELARAVDYLNEPRHQAEDGSLVGVQHRDIKPDNIFLVGGSVRLADFGLAKILAATVASTQGSMSPVYAAPEVIQGQFSRWSDQYSLAATYCQLRTGRPPFEGENAMQIIYAHVHRVPDLPGLPEAERRVVARALAKPPAERWPTCRAFVHALIVAAREDDRRTSVAAANPAGPPAVGATKLLETQGSPPISPIRVGDEDSSRVAAGATAGRFVRAGLAALVVVLGLVLAVIVIPRLGRSVDRTPRETPLASETTIPQPTGPVESPKRITRDPRPIAVVPAPVPVEPRKLITNSIGMKLVLIPSGEFAMGSPDSDNDAQDDEKPQHRVRITRPFYLGATEVTLGQFRQVVEKSGQRTEAEKDGKGGNGWNEEKKSFEQAPKFTWRNPGFAQTDEHPVVNVSWNDAIAFCNTLSEQEGLKPYYQPGAGAMLGGDGYRLPTEAEWEYACRAGTTSRYQSGDDPETLALVGNSADGTARARYPNWPTIAARDGYVFTAPVGQFRPNLFGLSDMHGNVWEWCWDGYKADYGQESKESPGADPLGPSQAASRVRRGGSWDSSPRHARSATRGKDAPGFRSSYLGFRVARAPSGR